MVDNLSPRERSILMSRVRNKDTKPELRVRRLLHSLGYRYRLHPKTLPGKPDLVFPGRRKVVFVHGCFWHRHKGCKLSSTPSSSRNFWREKFIANVERDRRNIDALENEGWDVLVVWQCETNETVGLKKNLTKFLSS
jgi:DNA mismatch endonuclease (patch repair protein)